MRFRCIIYNVKLFTQITQAFAKLLGNGHAIVRFTHDAVYVGQSGVDTTVKSWLQLNVCVIEPDLKPEAKTNSTKNTLFSEYRCESSNNNEVHIEVSMEHLFRAIKSAHESDNVLLRLMKKGAIPTLNLSISTLSHYNSRFTIEQDVPCRPQKQIYVNAFVRPETPDKDVTIQLPNMSKLKTVLEKLRILDNFVSITADWKGVLEFSILNDNVGVRTTFQGQETQAREGATAKVIVDSRQLIKLFGVPELASKAFIGICNNSCLAFYGFFESFYGGPINSSEHLMFVIPSKVL